MNNREYAKKTMDEMWKKHEFIDEIEAVESKQRTKLTNEMSSFYEQNCYEQKFLINSLYHLNKLTDINFNEMRRIENQANGIYDRLYPDAIDPDDIDDETK